MTDVYKRLADHMSELVMGYPFSDGLMDLLQAMFDPIEAEIALAIPNDLAPLEAAGPSEIAARAERPVSEVSSCLENMAGRNMLFSTPLSNGETGYALHQVGYGMPQAFFWHGKTDETAKRMAKLVLKYFTIPVTGQVYGQVSTKTFKYSPAELAVDMPQQGVLPPERIGPIIEATEKIALAHCPCRMSARILGRTDCKHSIEVCFKYDEMAEFVIDKGLARPVSKDETLSIMAECEREGLVHMVDNAQGEIKHTCNCCGHYCWNVGIIRRRKIPRDQLMAVYFTRSTREDECAGCGACADICPVDAVTMTDHGAVIDQNWCIGCGVCGVVCPADCISIVRRDERSAPKDVAALHQQIRIERGLV